MALRKTLLVSSLLIAFDMRRSSFSLTPSYVATKKKPLAERLQSQGKGSKSRKKKKKATRTSMLDTIEEKDETILDEIENLESEEVTEETEVLKNEAVNGDGIYIALSNGPLNYVTVINLVAPEVGGSHFGFLVTLVAVLLTIGCYLIGYVHGRHSRDVVSNTALERLQTSERQSSAFAVVLPLRLVYLFTYVLQCNISSYVTFWLK